MEVEGVIGLWGRGQSRYRLGFQGDELKMGELVIISVIKGEHKVLLAPSQGESVELLLESIVRALQVQSGREQQFFGQLGRRDKAW